MSRDKNEELGLIARLLSLSGDERGAVAWSFLCFFSILCAYFLLRPVRDEMAILAGPENIPDLFVWTFVAVLLLVPVFGWITKRFARRAFLPAVFLFSAACLLVFYWVFGVERLNPAWTARAFFVWLSVFNMFVVSLFWSFMADLYNKDQARRLFGLIAGGGSAGAICGPLFTAILVGEIGIRNLFLIAAALLILTVFSIHKLLGWARRFADDDHPVNETQPIGGSLLEGVWLVTRTPYLAAIAAIILMGVFSGTALYMYQAQLFAEHIPDSQQRTQLLASMDMAINMLTLFLQIVVARHAIRRLGVAVTLSMMPVFSTLVFLAVVISPGVGAIVVLQVLRRAMGFGLYGPARETLFSVVAAHSKYKAKNFMDVTLVRGADVISSQSIRLVQSLGQGFAAVAWLCVGVCLAWAVCAWLTGRIYKKLYAAMPGDEEIPR